MLTSSSSAGSPDPRLRTARGNCTVLLRIGFLYAIVSLAGFWSWHFQGLAGPDVPHFVVVPLRAPTHQAIAMNSRVLFMMASSSHSPKRCGAAASRFRTPAISLITWTAIGLRCFGGVAVQHLGPASRPLRQSVHIAGALRLIGAVVHWIVLSFLPTPSAGKVRYARALRVESGTSCCGAHLSCCSSPCATYTAGLQGRSTQKSALPLGPYRSIIPLSICFVIQRTGTLQPIHIWVAILVGHAARCALSILRFNQGKWRGIEVDIGQRPPG